MQTRTVMISYELDPNFITLSYIIPMYICVIYLGIVTINNFFNDKDSTSDVWSGDTIGTIIWRLFLSFTPLINAIYTLYVVACFLAKIIFKFVDRPICNKFKE